MKENFMARALNKNKKPETNNKKSTQLLLGELRLLVVSGFPATPSAFAASYTIPRLNARIPPIMRSFFVMAEHSFKQCIPC
jgi:hypothetical protein